MFAARRLRAIFALAAVSVAGPLAACAGAPRPEPVLAVASAAPPPLAAEPVALPQPLPRPPRIEIPPGVRVPPPFDGLRTTPAVLDQIRDAEGLRLEAYRDVGGRWTIGYGHTRQAREGMVIAAEDAERLLREDIVWFEAVVIDAVTAPLNAAEFSALVSFAFNVGETAFRASDVRRRLDAGDRLGAADALLAYIKTTRPDGRRVDLAGLVRRRETERATFLSEGEASPAPRPEALKDPPTS